MSKLDNFDRAKVGYDRMDAHDNHIWNEAIEASSAKVCDAFGNDSGIAAEIRELKR